MTTGGKELDQEGFKACSVFCVGDRRAPMNVVLKRVRVANGTELSSKAEGPTCLFGFFEIVEVVPGAGLGEGMGNRR